MYSGFAIEGLELGDVRESSEKSKSRDTSRSDGVVGDGGEAGRRKRPLAAPLRMGVSCRSRGGWGTGSCSNRGIEGGEGAGSST